jgi:thioesterase domain-containing protein
MALDRFQAHTFSGLGGPLTDAGTQQIDKYIDLLPPVPDNQHWIWQKSPTVFKLIVDDFKKNGPCAVILGGHSYGVLAAIRVAQALAKLKIGVDYLYAIDPTAGSSQGKEMVVTSNIKDIDEFWATRGYPTFMRKLTKGKQATLKIPEGWADANHTYDRHIIKGGHMNCASDGRTHTIVLNKVRAIVS